MPSATEDLTIDDPPKEINPYEVLGVTKEATLKEVTSAYRKLALKHHPGVFLTSPSSSKSSSDQTATAKLTKPRQSRSRWPRRRPPQIPRYRVCLRHPLGRHASTAIRHHGQYLRVDHRRGRLRLAGLLPHRMGPRGHEEADG